ncbi:hypothetical protein Dimus_035055, partial [Dionaea muscipula]
AYAPPYLSAEYAPVKPTILFGDRVLRYHVLFSVFSYFFRAARMVVLTVTGISPVSATSYVVWWCWGLRGLKSHLLVDRMGHV